MLDLELKIVQIVQVLASMPVKARLLAVRRILPDGYAVVPQRCSPDMQDAFAATAQRFHGGLKTKLAFAATALPSCWRAMLVRAERQLDDECGSNHLVANNEDRGAFAPRVRIATDALDPVEGGNRE
jgi:hypothetical protein